jgi:hypothetical protein
MTQCMQFLRLGADTVYIVQQLLGAAMLTKRQKGTSSAYPSCAYIARQMRCCVRQDITVAPTTLCPCLLAAVKIVAAISNIRDTWDGPAVSAAALNGFHAWPCCTAVNTIAW